jgi:hypothetical protein
MSKRMHRLRSWQRKLAWPFWGTLMMAYSAMAASVVIDALDADYRGLSQVAGTSAQSPQARRSLSAAQLAAIHRARSPAPFTTLPPGSTFQVVWPDGSQEYVLVVDPASSAGVESIPGTRRAADGSTVREDVATGAGDALRIEPR